jgi:hypothetical protein
MIMIPLLWDNDLTQAAAAHSAYTAAGAANRAASATDFLAVRMDRMVLAVTAMWSLLREKTSLTEEDLEARVRELDLRDGRLDGKIARQPVQCSSCRRPLSPRHASCFYCGGEIDRSSALDGAR